MFKIGGGYVNKKLCNVHMYTYPSSSTNVCWVVVINRKRPQQLSGWFFRVDNPGSQKIKEPLGVHNHNSLKFWPKKKQIITYENGQSFTGSFMKTAGSLKGYWNDLKFSDSDFSRKNGTGGYLILT
jgi:hypothetical protein